MQYLNNKELLSEIHQSKLSFCEFEDDKYQDYDVIIEDIKVLSNNKICTKYFGEWDVQYKKISRWKKQEISRKLIKKITVDEWLDQLSQKKQKPINKLVFRLMTLDHVPADQLARCKNKKGEICYFAHLRLRPFQHYILDDNPVYVGASHLNNGQFDTEHGCISTPLAKMLMELVGRIGNKSNWKGYSYIDEMYSNALLDLSQKALLFNEIKSKNPFAYYTTITTNAFTAVLLKEQRQTQIRNIILETNNITPSFSKQVDYEMADWDN